MKEDNPKEVAKHYLKTWFVIDLLAAIPFDWIVHNHQDGVNSHVSPIKINHLYRVPKKRFLSFDIFQTNCSNLIKDTPEFKLDFPLSN